MTGIAAWLIVPDTGLAAEFYRRAFDARTAESVTGAESPPVLQLSIDGVAVWLQAGEAERPPLEPGVRLILLVDDPERWFQRAVEAGAEEVHGLHTEFGWHTGRLRDPFGHQWETARRLTG